MNKRIKKEYIKEKYLYFILQLPSFFFDLWFILHDLSETVCITFASQSAFIHPRLIRIPSPRLQINPRKTIENERHNQTTEFGVVRQRFGHSPIFQRLEHTGRRRAHCWRRAGRRFYSFQVNKNYICLFPL